MNTGMYNTKTFLTKKCIQQECTTIHVKYWNVSYHSLKDLETITNLANVFIILIIIFFTFILFFVSYANIYITVDDTVRLPGRFF